MRYDALPTCVCSGYSLEWLERAREFHVCFFALSFVLLIDLFRSATGHPGVRAMSFESLGQIELHEWIVFGSIAVVFYALASRWLQAQLLDFLLSFPLALAVAFARVFLPL
jgi:hypothetical protein